MGPFLTSSEFDDNRNDLSAAGPQRVGSRLRPQPPGAAAFLWRGFPGDSRLSHDCLIRGSEFPAGEPVVDRIAGRAKAKRRREPPFPGARGSTARRPKPVDCNDLPRRDSAGLSLAAHHGFGQAAPVFTQASTSAPASFCVPGAGLRPDPGAHAQPTRWSPPICVHEGLKRPIAVARRILDLGADLAERLALPSHFARRQMPDRIARHARRARNSPPDGRSDSASPAARSHRGRVRPAADAAAPHRPGAAGRRQDGN